MSIKWDYMRILVNHSLSKRKSSSFSWHCLCKTTNLWGQFTWMCSKFLLEHFLMWSVRGRGAGFLLSHLVWRSVPLPVCSSPVPVIHSILTINKYHLWLWNASTSTLGLATSLHLFLWMFLLCFHCLLLPELLRGVQKKQRGVALRVRESEWGRPAWSHFCT